MGNKGLFQRSLIAFESPFKNTEGSKSGELTMARISPVFTSEIITAPASAS
jgi:hypothetical protein